MAFSSRFLLISALTSAIARPSLWEQFHLASRLREHSTRHTAVGLPQLNRTVNHCRSLVLAYSGLPAAVFALRRNCQAS
jgi:hypothetical protein